MYYDSLIARFGQDARRIAALYTLVSSMNCVICDVSDQDQRLNKCPICFKWACDECGNRSMGRVFCSRSCADQFFFGDDDDDY